MGKIIVESDVDPAALLVKSDKVEPQVWARKETAGVVTKKDRLHQVRSAQRENTKVWRTKLVWRSLVLTVCPFELRCASLHNRAKLQAAKATRRVDLTEAKREQCQPYWTTCGHTNDDSVWTSCFGQESREGGENATASTTTATHGPTLAFGQFITVVVIAVLIVVFADGS